MTSEQVLIQKPRAVITGASDRVGRAISLELSKAGFDLCLHWNTNEKGISETARLARIHQSNVHCIQANLAHKSESLKLADDILLHWDRVDVLVHNAASFYITPFTDLSAHDWDKILHVNLIAPGLITQKLVPALQASNAHNQACLPKPIVIFLCDIGSDRPLKGYSAYTSSKAGLVALTRSLAIELAPQIRSVGISPGVVCPPIGFDSAQLSKIESRIPLGSQGSPEDVARLVRFISLEGAYLNGAIIPLDGGLSCRY